MKRMAIVAVSLAIMATSLLSFVGNAASTDDSASRDSLRADRGFTEIEIQPHLYKVIGQASDKVSSKSLIEIHSTVPLDDKSKHLTLRAGSVRYFRTYGTGFDRGRHISITWSIDGESHSTDIGTPGPVIMVVRSLDGTITWHSLDFDSRC